MLEQILTSLSVEKLTKKIENIKAERERTENALKQYEAELERRKNVVPLGVPYDGCYYINWRGDADDNCRFQEAEKVNLNAFNSKESAERHAKMLLAWRKALVANAKCEPIDIEVLRPLLKKGKVFYDPCMEEWFWAKKNATVTQGENTWIVRGVVCRLTAFNLKLSEDWRNSLMECGL